jgi:transcriptional regulator with XRE-family HTH domain|nr:MAG TPA: Repressor protein CI [Bacteriophage sp.]
MLRLLTFGLLHNLEGLFLFYFRYVDLCNKINKSPSAVAEELGFKRSSVTRWANNSVPRQATLQKIADYFGVTVEYLKGEETKKDPATNGEVSPEKRELLDLIDSLSDDQCGKLSNIIKEAINLL